MTARDNLIALLQSSRQVDPRTLEAHLEAVEREAGDAVRRECVSACLVLRAEQRARHTALVRSGESVEEASAKIAAFAVAADTLAALAPDYSLRRRRTDRSPTANGERDDSDEVPTEER